MSYCAIRVEHLGKRYQIGKQRTKYEVLYETVMDSLAAPFRRIGKLLRGQGTGAAGLDEPIWVLNDVSFRIQQGEIVGIIGRNGAGKTTLLKILSGITEPTAGLAGVRGRVASLLEVGVGFHPELTGRENIYLNAAILGMPRVETDRKLEAIVTFAEVERFLETPVKYYSSGMKTRLAFAVAAHLEPEILIVDEVLAVGDTRFQRKCLQKMEEVRQQGHTILFVSHDMSAISRLCERAILLDAGRVVDDGPADRVVHAYLRSMVVAFTQQEWPDRTKAPGDDLVRLGAARVRTQGEQIADTIDVRQPFAIEMEYEVLKPGYRLRPQFKAYNENAIPLFTSIDTLSTVAPKPRPPGRYISRAWIPGNYLAEGTLFVEISVSSIEPDVVRFAVRDAVAIQVIDRMEGDSARGQYAGRLDGVVRPLLAWETEYAPHEQAENRIAVKTHSR